MGRGRNFTRASYFLVAVGFGAAPSFAQDVNGGVLTAQTGIDIDSNRYLDYTTPGTSSRIYQRLDYGIRRETSDQIFEFSAGTQLEYTTLLDGDGSDFGLNETDLRFLYAKMSANSRLQFDGRYSYGDTADAFDTDPTDPSLIGVDEGSLFSTNTNFRYETGIVDPFGFWIGAGYETRNYYDGTDPRNLDSTTTNLGVGATFQFSGRTEGSVSIELEDFQDEAIFRERVETADLTFGLTHELQSGLTLLGEVGYGQRDSTILATTITESGYIANASFVQERPNGTIFGGIGYDGSRFLDEYSLNIGRSLALPDGSLTASIEFLNVENDGLNVLGEIDYVRETASGELTISISRDQDTDSRFRDVYFTSVGVDYLHRINSASDFRLALDLSRSEDKYFAALIPIEDRATFTASYSRAVTPAWDLNVGYRHREYTAEGIDTANSDSIFLTMTRDVGFGF